MLDANFNVALFSIQASSQNKTNNLSNTLILEACRVFVFGKEQPIYSELEEQTFNIFNSNYGLGSLYVEFAFKNNVLNEGYPRFYANCFTIRTDTQVSIKMEKSKNFISESKVNQDGQIVTSIQYYFEDKTNIDKLIKCKVLLIEGFIALEKPTNIFGIMCQLKSEGDEWKILSAYTYKPHHIKNIKYLSH